MCTPFKLIVGLVSTKPHPKVQISFISSIYQALVNIHVFFNTDRYPMIVEWRWHLHFKDEIVESLVFILPRYMVPKNMSPKFPFLRWVLPCFHTFNSRVCPEAHSVFDKVCAFLSMLLPLFPVLSLSFLRTFKCFYSSSPPHTKRKER